jgi:hypothetical protein
VERSDPAAFGGKATLSEVTVKFDRSEAPPIHLMLVVPNNRTKGAPVYRLLGAGDFNAEALPEDGRLIDGALAFYLRPGAHSLLKEDWKVFLDFADKHLGRP